MTLERRFQSGFEEEATDDPGLVIGQDGVVRVVDQAGTRSEVSGGSSPIGHGAEIYVASLSLVYEAPAIQVVPFDTVQFDTDGIADLPNRQLVIPAGMDGLWGYGFAVRVTPDPSPSQIIGSAQVDGNAWNLNDVSQNGGLAGPRTLNAYAVDVFTAGDAITFEIYSVDATILEPGGSGSPPRLFAHFLGSLT